MVFRFEKNENNLINDVKIKKCINYGKYIRYVYD